MTLAPTQGHTPETLPAGAHITLKYRQSAVAGCLSGADL